MAGMAGDIEELRQAQHGAPYWLLRSVNIDRCRAQFRRRRRLGGEKQRIAGLQRTIDRRASIVAKVHGPDIVFREHISAHLEPQSNARRIPVGVRGEHRRVVPGRLRQDDVQVHVGGTSGVLDVDDSHLVTGRCERAPCLLNAARTSGCNRSQK